MAQRKNQSNFINGVSQMLVLRLLAQREMYGYELVKAIREATGNSISPGEGVVYPLLHALEREGCLATRRLTHQGRDRVYYRLTRTGHRSLNESVSDWHRIAQAVQGVIGGAGGGHDPAHSV